MIILWLWLGGIPVFIGFGLRYLKGVFMDTYELSEQAKRFWISLVGGICWPVFLCYVLSDCMIRYRRCCYCYSKMSLKAKYCSRCGKQRKET